MAGWLSVADYQWDKSVYYSNVGGSGPAIGPATGYFYFDRYPTPTTQQAAGGQLSANVISISPGLYSQAQKAKFAADAASDYAGSLSPAWAELIMNPGGALGTWIGDNLLAQDVVDFDQIFASQQLELSQGIIQKLLLIKGAQSTIPGLPERYQIPGLAQLGLAIESAVEALDPPDWDYTVVQPPSILSLPMTGDPTVDKMVGDYLTVSATRRQPCMRMKDGKRPILQAMRQA